MRNNNWVFGLKAGLNFSTNPPTPLSGFDIQTAEGCTSVSDNNGDLLFYTDGRIIWDGRPGTTNAPITGLNGNMSSTQSAVIVLDPADPDQYYVFTADGVSGSNNHFDGGVLNVNTWNFTPLTGLPSTAGLSPVEKISAIEHSNGTDYWVFTILQPAPVNRAVGPGTMRIFLVSASGVTHVGDTILDELIDDHGYMKSSPDGSKIAIASISRYEIHVYDFDNTTGVLNVANRTAIPTVERLTYGIEFSPNSQLLYYSTMIPGKVYQTELSNPTQSTSVGVVSYPSGGTTGAFQLGRDNVIYIAKSNTGSLAAILNPDALGQACNYVNDHIQLPKGAMCALGLPNLVPEIKTSVSNDDDCNCGCNGCNETAEEDNEILAKRAQEKYNLEMNSGSTCGKPFDSNCNQSLTDQRADREPCFSFHWGDGANDSIEEHDTEIFYLTVCNKFNDVRYEGLRITSVRVSPTANPEKAITIVPDRLVTIGCLLPCACQTREFAIITRGIDIAGDYELIVDYCYDQIVISESENSGSPSFKMKIVAD